VFRQSAVTTSVWGMFILTRKKAYINVIWSLALREGYEMLNARMSVRARVVAALDEGVVAAGDIASLIGAPRGQVSTCLSKLARDGAIDHERRIVDRSIAERGPGRPRVRRSSKGGDAASVVVTMCVDSAEHELRLAKQAISRGDAAEVARRLVGTKTWLEQAEAAAGAQHVVAGPGATGAEVE